MWLREEGQGARLGDSRGEQGDPAGVEGALQGCRTEELGEAAALGKKLVSRI
jgi:hypothetical protein